MYNKQYTEDDVIKFIASALGVDVKTLPKIEIKMPNQKPYERSHWKSLDEINSDDADWPTIEIKFLKCDFIMLDERFVLFWTTIDTDALETDKYNLKQKVYEKFYGKLINWQRTNKMNVLFENNQ